MKAEAAFVLAFREDISMNSARHTALHEICFRPMLGYVLDEAQKATANEPVVITGFDAESVEAYAGECAATVRVAPELENAEALCAAVQNTEEKQGYVLVVSGNAPLLRAETLSRLIEAAQGNAASALISEQEDEDDAQKHAECLAYCIDVALLKNAKGSIREFLTGVRQNGGAVVNVFAPQSEYVEVQNRVSLWECGFLMQSRVNVLHMLSGITILDPTNTHIAPDVVIGRDTVLYPNVILAGKTKIGENCVIYDGCRLNDTLVGNNCALQSVVANKAEIGNDVTAGPFVNLRPDTRLGDGCKVGDFVEVKNSVIGEKTKVPHLSYVGDADVGARVNVGCGCVFVNYDGYKKHRTVVGNDVFLGCQTNLVAPVKVGDDAYTAAGSTITSDVPSGALALARARQENKTGWVEKNRAKKRD